jgi:hypothetical protein
MSKITRRDFLRTTAGVTVASALGGLTGAAEPSRSKVVLIRDPKAVGEGGRPQAEPLGRMLDDAVAAFTGKDDPAAAWKTLVKPSDRVGIKSNVWRFLRTPESLEQAIVRRLAGAGVGKDAIGIDDRGVLQNRRFLEATALINVRPMRTHHWSGVGSLIKNYIMFHPEPWTWHDDSCADLAGLWDLPVVKGKTRLNILVMLTPLFQSKGPHAFSRKFTWPYAGLLVGSDPVAVDAVGLRILEAKRREHFGREEPFHVSPKHIRVAEEKFGLGVADPERIDLVRLGENEGALI